jgi:hypothetical protein
MAGAGRAVRGSGGGMRDLNCRAGATHSADQRISKKSVGGFRLSASFLLPQVTRRAYLYPKVRSNWMCIGCKNGLCLVEPGRQRTNGPDYLPAWVRIDGVGRKGTLEFASGLPCRQPR